MKFLFCILIILFFNQLFCQIDFYIETDETCYSFGQDIYITFHLHNTTSDTVIVIFQNTFPFNYYIDDDFFLIGAFSMIVYTTILPYSTFSTIPYIHTDNVSIGDHILIGEFNSTWISDPVSITIESVGVENYELSLISYHLSNYPNPFNPSTEISFSVPQTSLFVTIEIFNPRGQKLKVLSVILSGVEGRGEMKYRVVWDGTNKTGKQVPSGVYLYKLVSGGKELATSKMLLLK
ncbi:MAG: hypothetical protein KAS53_08735 [Candidatus Cloacimonetes bacterium]|nr:hypothetical protein [Candidatus Cloacimonadota bacterium]